MDGKTLATFRKALGMTQQQLADALQIHRVSVVRYEKNKEPIPLLVALAVEALQARARKKITGGLD